MNRGIDFDFDSGGVRTPQVARVRAPRRPPMLRPGKGRHRSKTWTAPAVRELIAAVVVLGVWGCGGDGEVGTGERGRDTGADTAAPIAPADGGSGAGELAVRVWFTKDESPTPVRRVVSARGGSRGGRVEAALAALVSGPTAAERDRGLSSWFSDSTRHVVRDVRFEGGLLVVDFTDLRERIPGASSSAGSRALLLALDSTVLQFPEVDSAEYRLDGSCGVFWEWLQRECRVVRREDGEGQGGGG